MNYENEDGITIETPVPGRYTITGFRSATVYVPDVGHLAPPPNIDLPMSPAIAAALRAVLDDYEPEHKHPLYRMDVKTGEVALAEKPRRGRQPKAAPVETPTEGGQE